MKTLLLVVNLLFWAFVSRGQENFVARNDSLLRLLSKTGQDTIRIEALFQLGELWQAKDLSKSIRYGQEAVNLAEKLHETGRLKGALFSLAFNHYLKGNAIESIDLLQKLLRLHKKEDPDYAVALAFLGMNYTYQGDYTNALTFMQQSVTSDENARKAGRPYDRRGYFGGGMSLAEIFEKMNRLDSASYYIRISYQRLLQEPLPPGGEVFDWQIPWIYGKIENRLNHDAHALALYREGLQKARKQDYDIGIQSIEMSLATYFRKINRADSAIFYATNALESARHTPNYPIISEAGFLLKTLYVAQNNPAKALYYYSLASAAKDSVISLEKTRQVQALTLSEERRQQELEAERLAYESQLKQVALSGALVLFSGVAFFLYRTNRQKQRLNDLLTRQKSEIETLNNDLERKVELRTTELQQALDEVQTAFDKGQTTERRRVSTDLHDEIGSALSTIAIFSDLTRRKAQKNAPELANDLERIGTKSRDMIQTMRDTIWTLNENNPQSLWERMHQVGNETLLDKGITFDWQGPSCEQTVPFAVKRHVLLAYKEALHNVVKHAGATTVRVTCTRIDQELALTISDNGRGFDVTTIRDLPGNGLRNFELRLKEIGGTATIESRVGQGTTLTFRWPATP